MNEIILSTNQDGQVFAQFLGPHSSDVVMLFDTDTLLTPFTTLTPRGAILAELQQRNPDALIRFR